MSLTVAPAARQLLRAIAVAVLLPLLLALVPALADDAEAAHRRVYRKRTTRTVATQPVAGVPPLTRTTTCAGTTVPAGADVQAAINGQATGATICLAPGVHRLTQPLRVKAQQTLVGIGGAVLNGSKVLSVFVPQGAHWVAEGQTQRFTPHGECAGGGTVCRYSEDVFVDGKPLEQVLDVRQLRAGRFFFDYAASRIVLADNPVGKLVETTVAPEAIVGGAGVNGVTVKGLIIERFGNLAQHGVVDTNGGTGWTIEGNDIRYNHGAGVRTNGRAIVRGNRIRHNGQTGVAGSGERILVEGNEIAFNNTHGFDPGWEAGAAKWVFTTDLVVRTNYVHDNAGYGLWTDTDNINSLYEGNRVEDNTHAGLFHEASYDAVVRNNQVRRNGHGGNEWAYGAGIQIAHSPNVTVTGNIVEGNARGITLIQQNRGSGKYGPHELRNVKVTGNTITMGTGFSGLSQDVGDRTYFTSRGNTFDGNTYRLAGTARPFTWMDRDVTAAEWKSFGQDTTGIFS